MTNHNKNWKSGNYIASKLNQLNNLKSEKFLTTFSNVVNVKYDQLN